VSVLVRKWLELTKFRTLSFGRKVWVVYLSIVLPFFLLAIFGLVMSVIFDQGDSGAMLAGIIVSALIFLGIPMLIRYKGLRSGLFRWLDRVAGDR
jgi:hypothetical protein